MATNTLHAADESTERNSQPNDAGFDGKILAHHAKAGYDYPTIRLPFTSSGLIGLLSFERLGTVIITHQDIDHIGSLPDIVRASSHNVDVLCHEEERLNIEDRKPLVKMNPERLSKMSVSLPEEQRQQMEALLRTRPKRASLQRSRIGRSCHTVEGSR